MGTAGLGRNREAWLGPGAEALSGWWDVARGSRRGPGSGGPRVEGAEAWGGLSAGVLGRGDLSVCHLLVPGKHPATAGFEPQTGRRGEGTADHRGTQQGKWFPG